MPRFEPFPGLRYAPDLEPATVTAPPYDVIDADERAALAASHPANAVHVDCPVGDLGSTSSAGGDAIAGDAYTAAAEVFERWQADGTLLADDRPSFTLYRMSFVDEAGVARATTGVLGALGLVAPGEGDVLPHERTTPKAKSDRLDLLRATHANLSAVWGLSLAASLSKLLEPSGPPLAEWTDPDGVTHAAWRLDDPAAVAAITDAVATAPVVIADGHHRYQTCLEFDAESDLPGAGATLALVVELAEEQLTVQPIHRLLRDLPADVDLPAAFAAVYDVTPVDAVAPGELALVTPAGRWRLTPKVDDGTLDTVRLDEALAALPEHTLAYQHGVANAVGAVEAGRAQAAVLLRAVTVAQIAAVAHARDRMPPKTTFFWPKPRTGVVYRSLR